MDVITVGGQLHHASESKNEEPFWAVYGGGSNFGLDTSFEFDLHEAMAPHAADGVHVNFVSEEVDEERATYRENYDRLATLKGRYAPENLFRMNQNGVGGLTARSERPDRFVARRSRSVPCSTRITPVSRFPSG